LSRRKVTVLGIILIILAVGCRTEMADLYQTFLPLVSCSDPEPTPTPFNPGKGLAAVNYNLNDFALLNISWYYVWSSSHAERDMNIPMSRCGEMVSIPQDTEYLLVFNEPNNREPAGCPVTPAQASTLVRALERAYPDTYIIVGNVHPYSNSQWGYPMYGWDWLKQFFAMYGNWKMGVGVHSYDTTYAKHLTQWNLYFSNLGTNRDYWLTEFNLTGFMANDNEFRKLIGGVDNTFDHYSIFTNRKENSWVPMVNDDGTLTSYGEIYKDY